MLGGGGGWFGAEKRGPTGTGGYVCAFCLVERASLAGSEEEEEEIPPDES